MTFEKVVFVFRKGIIFSVEHNKRLAAVKLKRCSFLRPYVKVTE